MPASGMKGERARLLFVAISRARRYAASSIFRELFGHRRQRQHIFLRTVEKYRCAMHAEGYHELGFFRDIIRHTAPSALARL